MRTQLSRRHLLKSAAAAGVGLAAMKSRTLAADAPKFKAGIIGCGGRGNGAGGDLLRASEKSGIKVELAAVHDVYEGQAKNAARHFNVDAAHTFWDFDGYKKLLDSGVDIVILGTPPGFRPEHFEAVVAAGKHCFCEKPVATFAQDCRRFIKAGEESVKKNLTVVAGTQRRHQRNYVETVAKIHDGAIGDIRALRAYWCGGPVMKGRPRTPGQKDMDFQLKAWYSFVWICGDQIVEQHLHNLDVCNWVMRGHPVSVYASGGCAWRPKEEWYGNIYDHLTADYTYAGGVHMLSMCRQYKGCDDNVSEAIVGAEGESNGVSIWRKGQKTFDGPGGENPYVQEHIDMLKNIVRGGGEPLLNEAVGVGESTMTAIMGRMSAYTGKVVTWDHVMKVNDSQMPESSWDAKIPIPPVAVPGA
ncbi:MAG TPA: gfo/Idh/MocA family oxidoreductase [Planctomycetes bacterium]|nr:gfo/Idh/MocA family oxidoreductase [Planctomycetota bacterium]